MSSAIALDTYQALIIDDEPVLRQALARALGQPRFHCDFAENGRQALRMIAEQRYDLVVTDLRMPEVNGHQLAVELLGRADRPIVIVVTGVTEPKIERDLRSRGVDEIMFKPIDYSILAARALAMIESRAARADVHLPAAAPVVEASSARDSIEDRRMPATDAPASRQRNVQQSIKSDPPATAPAASGSPSAAASPSAACQPPAASEPEVTRDEDAASEADEPILYRLVSQKFDRLEGHLWALSGERKTPWFWLLLIFVNGLCLGWLMATWAR
ncbi:MAG TPA: response regulator [Pirellulales bacterium]|jgi:DNA-binding response OmpR family regulator|nr:response regulator [Pirellulales bacterium]